MGQITNALTCFEAALTVFTPDSFPRECIGTGLELGKLTLAAGKKAEAFRCFAIIIEAVEMLSRWENYESLHQEIPANISAYIQIVTLCLACGEREKVREYAERLGSPFILDLLQNVQLQQITSVGQFFDLALKTVVENENNPQAFYQLLEDNLEQLNDSLVEILNTIKLFFPALGPAEEINIAAAILSFSRLIQHFDKGDEENNWEIAKAGYEVAAAVFTQEKFPE